MKNNEMKCAVVVLCYTRPDYLKQTLESLSNQLINERPFTETYDLYISQDGLSATASDDIAQLHKQSAQIIYDIFPKAHIYLHPSNLGIAWHFDRVERLLFEEKNYDYVVFFEDDMVLLSGYMEVINKLRLLYADDERIGMVAAFGAPPNAGDLQSSLEAGQLTLMHHNWGFGLPRSFWQERQLFVDEYLKILGNIPYKQRPHETIKKWMEFCGLKYLGSSQDFVKQCATFILGGIRITPKARLGQYIGVKGEHFSEAIFKAHGFDSAIYYEGKPFEVEELTQAKYNLFYEQLRSQYLTDTRQLSMEDIITASQMFIKDTLLSKDTEFRLNIEKYPNQLDQYSHPTHKKEFMRMLLSQQRWSEATALIPNEGDLGGHHWHEILFARDYTIINDITNAKIWWNHVIENDPNNVEAKAFFAKQNESSQKIITTRVWNKNDISARPAMEKDGIDLLGNHLKKAKTFLEYGAGGSTVFAAELGVKNIYSVESDKSFLDTVQQKIASLYPSAKVNAYFVDIGKTKEWGHPVNKENADLWPKYCVAPWQEIMANSQSPDLILIDGRFRVACFLASLLLAKKGTIILFDDYIDRPNYHIVEKYLKPNKTAGRMTEFVVKPGLSPSLVLLDLMAYSSNPA